MVRRKIFEENLNFSKKKNYKFSSMENVKLYINKKKIDRIYSQRINL